MQEQLKMTDFSNIQSFQSFSSKISLFLLQYVWICVNGMCVCLRTRFVQLKSIPLFSFQLFQLTVGWAKLGAILFQIVVMYLFS